MKLTLTNLNIRSLKGKLLGHKMLLLRAVHTILYFRPLIYGLDFIVLKDYAKPTVLQKHKVNNEINYDKINRLRIRNII